MSNGAPRTQKKFRVRSSKEEQRLVPYASVGGLNNIPKTNAGELPFEAETVGRVLAVLKHQEGDPTKVDRRTVLENAQHIWDKANRSPMDVALMYAPRAFGMSDEDHFDHFDTILSFCLKNKKEKEQEGANWAASSVASTHECEKQKAKIFSLKDQVAEVSMKLTALTKLLGEEEQALSQKQATLTKINAKRMECLGIQYGAAILAEVAEKFAAIPGVPRGCCSEGDFHDVQKVLGLPSTERELRARFPYTSARQSVEHLLMFLRAAFRSGYVHNKNFKALWEEMEDNERYDWTNKYGKVPMMQLGRDTYDNVVRRICDYFDLLLTEDDVENVQEENMPLNFNTDSTLS